LNFNFTFYFERRLAQRNLNFNFSIVATSWGAGARAEEGAEGALAELVAEEGLEDVLEAAEWVSAGAGGSGT
jgi:hypothetical protein